MSNYKEMKKVFFDEERKHNKRISELEAIINRHKKIETIIEESVKTVDKRPNPERFTQLKRFFPNLEKDFQTMEKLSAHKWNVLKDIFGNFDPISVVRDLTYCNKEYGVPAENVLEEVKNDLLLIERIKLIDINRYAKDKEEVMKSVRRHATKLAEMAVIIADVYTYIANKILKDMRDKLSKTNIEELEKEIDTNKEKASLINKFNNMFSYNELLTKFSTDEELEEFTNLIKSLFSNDKCKEILSNVSIDQVKVKEEKIVITFDNLDMSKFNEDEKRIITEIKEIIEDSYILDKDLKSKVDNIKNNLIEKIYTDKEMVFNEFKNVINLYQKYVLRIMREEKEKELLRIRNDFNNIKSFINRTYMDKNNAFELTKTIDNYLRTIDSEYLPTIRELIETDYDEDDFYDTTIDSISKKFMGIIKEYKEEMSLYNSNGEKEEVIDNKENTVNLVFCLTDDLELSNEGYQKEFVGTVMELESKSDWELRSKTGRKIISKLRKTGDDVDGFMDQFENRDKTKYNFTPYRYSSESSYRTGLIAFAPSEVVKRFLEEKYNLSKLSSIYGIYRIIQSRKADHSEYSYLREYIYDNFNELVELSNLFASENPDYDKLTSKVDELLAIKKDLLNKANDKKSRK